jgi:hypothetical protein
MANSSGRLTSGVVEHRLAKVGMRKLGCACYVGVSCKSEVKMLEADVKRVVAEVTAATLPPNSVERVFSVTPAIGSNGEEVLRITIVLEPTSVARISGKEALDTLVKVSDRLLREGEERFPILEYATEQDLQDGTLEMSDSD